MNPAALPPASEGANTQLVLTVARVLFSNGQMTDQVQAAAHRLAAAMGLDATLVARWNRLTLMAGSSAQDLGEQRVLGVVECSPTGVNMDRVAAAMAVIAEVEATGLSPGQACEKLQAIARRAPVADWTFALAAAAGAVALAVLFGLRHVPAGWLIFLCVGMGALLRRALARLTGNLLVQPFVAALLAGIVGGLAVRFDLSSSLRLVAVCPCMVLVPGPHLLNAVADALKGRLALALGRLVYASTILVVIAIGLLSGLTALGVALPTSPPAVAVPLWADMIAAAVAVVAFSVFFSTPWRMVAWPIAVGVSAHAVRWWLLAAGVDLALAALAACILVAMVLTPVSHRYHMPFAAIGFAAVVSMIPGVFVFRMASDALDLLRLGTDCGCLGQLADNSWTAASIVVAMGLGLIISKLVIDRLSGIAPRGRRQLP